MRMPDCAGIRTRTARFCLAVFLVASAPGHMAHAAGNAQAWPEQDNTPPEHLYSILEKNVTLTGFHCDVINSREQSAFADPDYEEMTVTVGVEVRLDAVSALQDS